MARYIDAEKLHYSRVRIAYSDGTIGGYHAVVMSAEIKDAPTADVVEVKHGKWLPHPHLMGKYFCSICSRQIEEWSLDPAEYYPYCHCGARMDKERRTT